MNKKLIVLASVLVLVAAACNKAPAQNQTQTNTPTQTQMPPPATPPAANNQSSMMSLKDLVMKGTQTCTYTDGANSGTVYIADGKIRVDIVAVTAGMTTHAHTMMDGTTNYTWIDGQPNGFKMSATAASSPAPANNPSASQQIDPNKQMNYQCSSWTADNSKFVLPTNIQFMDFSSMKYPAGY